MLDRTTGRLLVMAAAIGISTATVAQVGPTSQPTQPGGPVQPAEGRPSIKREAPPLATDPENRIIDLGFVTPESKTPGTITLTNTSAEPIRIQRTTTTCHCTVAELAKDTLEPGESIALTATLEAGKYPGAQQKQVRVFVEGYAVPLQVYVVAEVAYGVRANPVFVDAFQRKAGEIDFESTNGQAFRVLGVNGKALEAADFADFDPAKDEPRTRYTLKYDFTQVQDADLPPWWIVSTDHPKGALVDLRVINPAIIPRLNGQEPWRMAEDRVLLGAIRPGEAKEFSVTLKPNNAANTEGEAAPTIQVDEGDAEVKLVKSEMTPDGMVCTLSLTPKSEAILVSPRVTVRWLNYSFHVDVFAQANSELARLVEQQAQD